MARDLSPGITRAQVRAVHAAKSRMGLDDDTYRAILEERYGVRSCKQLSRRQATELLTGLGRPLPRPARERQRRAPRLPKGAGRLVTPAQRELIAEIAGEIEWAGAGGYEGWLRSNMGIDRVATSEQGVRVIQGLLAIRRRRKDVG